jgi:hypothetical protein
MGDQADEGCEQLKGAKELEGGVSTVFWLFEERVLMPV